MPRTLAVIGAGAMGSAVGQRLTAHGARVITPTEGRSERTVERAKAAGMIPAASADLATVEFILSIVPPGEAVGIAAELASVLKRSPSKPVYIDLNAISPTTVAQVASEIQATGCSFVDGAIIGGPPRSGGEGPTFYLSGDAQRCASVLSELGLKVRTIDGPIGAASALKMVYAGINKGLTALGAAMLLAADRADCTDALRQELSESAPEILGRLRRNIPDMYPKAYRWVAEMKEIAAFLGPDDPAARFFKAAADLYKKLADDQQSRERLSTSLNRACGNEERRGPAG